MTPVTSTHQTATIDCEINKQTAASFIQKIWNEQDFSCIPDILHPMYHDYSLLPQMPANAEGLRQWVEATSNAFEHKTEIESMVAEGDQVALRIRFHVKHTGTWRGIAPTGRDVSIKGFRFFRLREGRIVEHHALIDGNALQTALSGAHQGCSLNRSPAQ